MRNGSRRGNVSLVLLAVLTLVATGCGAHAGVGEPAKAEFTIRFSHVVAPETPKGMAAGRFKEEVERRSEGRIAVEIYPNSDLYGDEDELPALQSSSVEVLAPATAKFAGIAPALQVLDLPFIFNSVEEIPEVVSPDSKIGRAIYENPDLANSNIKVLGLWDNGLKQLTTNTEEVHTPEDLEGLRFRVQPSEVLRSQFGAWGAETTQLAFNEVFNALQQGVIDGQENSYSNIESQNIHTVQSNLTISNHGYIGYVLVINGGFFDSLPEDLQQAVLDSAAAATAYNREIASQVNEEARNVIEEAGTTEIYELTPEERQEFRDAVVPEVWEEYADVIGEDIVDELLEREEPSQTRKTH